VGSYRLITPEGTKDYLFEEAVLRKNVENKLRDAFRFRGYHEVVTPSIEFLDVFDTNECGMPIEQMYKMVDAKGRLTVLRPDSTMPIARLCATRLKKETMPLRLYYNQPVFSINPSLRGRSDEVLQAGIELIGVTGKKSDLEVVVTAIKVLQDLKIENFRLELGHIGLFNSLISQLNLSSSAKEEIRQMIEDKNYPALNDRLDELENQSCASVIKMLPRLFGGQEVFRRARDLMTDNETVKVLDYLEELYTSLSALGLKEKITVDLGIVNRTDYYTGIVFKGYVEGYGEEVLSGGRYDGLLKEFGKDLGAIGFAVNIDSAVKALLNTKSHQISPVEVLVFAQPENQMKALEYIQRLAEVKIVTEYSLFDTIEETLDYAKEKGIHRIDMVGDEVKTIDLSFAGQS
jgi:ATP phosphoribosyltransferase regulatory subunit